MKTAINAQKQILDFVEYVDSFYNPKTGIYPIEGATVEVITKSIKIYLDSITDNETWGDGDSVDRERVRDIIFQNGGKVPNTIFD